MDIASEEGDGKEHCFEMSFGAGSSPHLFSALSDADKQDWVKLFRKCVKVTKLLKNHHFVLFLSLLSPPLSS